MSKPSSSSKVLRDLLRNYAFIRGVKNWASFLIYKCNKYILENFYYENLFCGNITIIKFRILCSIILYGTGNVFLFISFK